VHPSRWLIVGGSAVAALALLLPFISSPATGSVNGISGDAWPAVALLAPVVAMALLGDRREGFSAWATASSVLLTAAATLFAVQKLVDAVRATRLDQAAGEVSVGIGAWVLVTGCVIALIGAAGTMSRRLA